MGPEDDEDLLPSRPDTVLYLAPGADGGTCVLQRSQPNLGKRNVRVLTSVGVGDVVDV